MNLRYKKAAVACDYAAAAFFITINAAHRPNSFHNRFIFPCQFNNWSAQFIIEDPCQVV